MERRRNWYRRRLEGKLRERAREEDPLDGFDQSASFLQSPVTPDINQLMKLTTEALRPRLAGVGLRNSRLLDRSDIYEQAIINLGIILDKAPLPSFLREATFSETVLLANSLLALFSAGVRLHVNQLTRVHATFSGHFEHVDGQIKKVSVDQWLKRTNHPQSGRVIHPSCQIFVREIISRPRSRAIGSSDLRVRCGLRFGGWISDNKWCVSINSGIPTPEDNQDQLLKSIGPITQAYNESRKYPESFYYLQNTDTINTFHFEDPGTEIFYPGESAAQFATFNRYLNLVFSRLASLPL